MSDVNVPRDADVLTDDGKKYVIPGEVAVHCHLITEMLDGMEPDETTPISIPIQLDSEVLEKIIESFNDYTKIDSSDVDRIPTSPGDCINIRPGDRVLVDTTTDTTAVADAADATDDDNKEPWEECGVISINGEKEFTCKADGGEIYKEKKGPKLQVVRAMNDLKKQEKIIRIFWEKLFSKLNVQQIYELFEGLEFLGFDPNSKFKQDLMGFYAIHLTERVSVREMRNMNSELDILVGEQENELVDNNRWISMFAEKCWGNDDRLENAFVWEGRGEEQRKIDKRVIFQ